MATRVKSIRLTDEEWAQLDAIAEGMGASASRAVAALVAERAGRGGETAPVTASVTASGGGVTASETAPGAGAASAEGEPESPSPIGKDLIDALTAQLATKDEQIARLMDALAASQDATRAAQALHAATTPTKAIEARSGRFRALWGRITGRQ